MNSTDKLKKLLSQHANFVGEKTRHEQMAIKLKTEEDRLMKTVNIENTNDFEKVSQVRLKREIVPNKIQNFGDAADRVKCGLAEECVVLTASHLKLVESKIGELAAKIGKALEPFFPIEAKFQNEATQINYEATFGAVFSASSAANRIVVCSSCGSTLIQQTEKLVNPNFVNMDAVRKANQLIEMVEEFELVKI